MSHSSPKRHSSMVNMRKVSESQRDSTALPGNSTSGAPTRQRKKMVDITNGLVPPSATEAYLERLKGWTDVVRRLIAHFEAIVEHERKLADTYFKSAKEMSQPIRVGGVDVFDPSESIQGVLKHLFDAQSKLSSEHFAAANHIETETLPELRSLLSEMRKKSLDGDKEWVELDKGLAKDRETYGKLAANLRSSIRRQLKVRGGAANPDLGVEKDVPKDPWIANVHMQRHVRTLLKNQTETRDALSNQEQNFAVFEQVTLQHLRLALTNHFTVSNKAHSAHLSAATTITLALNSMDHKADWKVFRSRRSDVILDPLRPLITEKEIRYEGMDDPGCEAVKEGPLLKRIPGVLRAKGFKPGYYVLTMSGFLHGFPAPEAVETGDPSEMSTWLPDCTVGPKGALDPKEPNEFLIQEKSGGFLRSEKYRLKAEGGDESDFWYELVAATATPLAPRPELLESLEEEPNSRPTSLTDDVDQAPAVAAAAEGVSKVSTTETATTATVAVAPTTFASPISPSQENFADFSSPAAKA
ncbi:hypothetical protein HDU96_006186, partial [Phlyctochytrium bullatum]